MLGYLSYDTKTTFEITFFGVKIQILPYICNVIELGIEANSVDPEQTAPTGAV